MTDEKRNQVRRRRDARSVRKVYPTEREVLLARLLLAVLDDLGGTDSFDVDLYNQCKSLAEGTVRNGL